MRDNEALGTCLTQESNTTGAVQALRIWTADRVSGPLMAFMSLLQGTEIYNILLRYALELLIFAFANLQALSVS